MNVPLKNLSVKSLAQIRVAKMGLGPHHYVDDIYFSNASSLSKAVLLFDYFTIKKIIKLK